jgi:hypothetical protein
MRRRDLALVREASCTNPVMSEGDRVSGLEINDSMESLGRLGKS